MTHNEKKFLFGPKGIILSVIAAAALAAAVFSVSLMSKAYGDAAEYGDPVVRLSGSGGRESGDSEPIMSYRELSEIYRALEATCEEWTDRENVAEGTESGLYFISEDNLAYCVYDTDSAALCGGKYTLDDFDYIWMNSEDDSFYVLVNLAGKTVDLSDYYILARRQGQAYASRVLINCYEAEAVDIENTILTGTLLAPYASVNAEGAYIYGQVLADNIYGEPAADREIRFTGYSALTGGLALASFTNDSVRAAAVRYLMDNDDIGLYADYNENSQLRVRDLVAVKELDLTGAVLDSVSFSKDISQLTGLEVLKLSGSNISELSLKAHPFLTELEADDTPLTSLTLTGAPSLLRLSLENTPLRALDLSACGQLRIVCLHGSRVGWVLRNSQPYLEYLDCSDTGISEETISGEGFPALKTLNISDNPGLLGLKAAEFGELTALDCSGTGLRTLTLGEGCKLTYLRASYTDIQVLDLRPIRQLYTCEFYGKDASVRLIRVNRYAETLYTDAAVDIS